MSERFRVAVDPVATDDLLALAAASPLRPLFWWEKPAAEFAMLAIGAVREIHARGPARFVEASAAVRRALADGEDAVAVGGFAFADSRPLAFEWREFPSLRFFVPRLLWLRERGRCRRVSVAAAGEEQANEALGGAVETAARRIGTGLPEPPTLGAPVADAEEHGRWRRRVEAALARIARGELEKVVLARSRRLRADRPPAVAALLARLREARPGCRSFWIAGAETDFFGSTPELLVRRRGDEVLSGALAGSAPRGGTAAEDRTLGERLLSCPKNRREHALVVDHVASALAPVTRRLDVPEAPALVRLPEAQHLHTPVRGRLREPRTVLELAGLLHPTPAVCGAPLRRARRLLEAEEPDRGWYAGGIGWMRGDGDGEIAVSLRSALLDGTTIVLRAGAGIVMGSDPDAELAETEAKLGALLRHIGLERSERAA